MSSFLSSLALSVRRLINTSPTITGLSIGEDGVKFTATDITRVRLFGRSFALFRDPLAYVSPFDGLGTVKNGSETTLGASEQSGARIGALQISDGLKTVDVGVYLGLGTADADTFDASATNNPNNYPAALYGFGGDDSLIGGIGNDGLFGGDGNDTLFGREGNDTIKGNNGDDLINGNQGTDLIDGGLGNDIIFGGRDNDTIDGGEGNDTINGDLGDDSILGGAGADNIDGGEGNDIIDGDVVGDTTTFGNDTINGGIGDDTIRGLSGDDSILGGDGNDVINGNQGNDFVDGGTGDDALNGGQGNDTIAGGAGNDTISGDLGADRLTGGDDADVFVQGATSSVAPSQIQNLTAGNIRFDSVTLPFIGNVPATVITFAGGVDVITGFQVGVDRLDIDEVSSVTTVANLVVNASNLPDNTLFLARGNFDSATNQFTFNALGGSDTLVAQSGGNSGQNDSLFTNASIFILEDVGPAALLVNEVFASTFI